MRPVRFVLDEIISHFADSVAEGRWKDAEGWFRLAASRWVVEDGGSE